MLLLLLCNVFTLWRLKSCMHNTTMSPVLRNATVKEAVDAVTRQTELHFRTNRRSASCRSAMWKSVWTALSMPFGPLFADKGIAWQVVDGVVILTRQNSPNRDSGRRSVHPVRAITAGAGGSRSSVRRSRSKAPRRASRPTLRQYEIVVPGPVLVFPIIWVIASRDRGRQPDADRRAAR